MTSLVERLTELRRHLDHLRALQPRVSGREAIEADLSLHNDVLFSVEDYADDPRGPSCLILGMAGEPSLACRVRSAGRRRDFSHYCI